MAQYSAAFSPEMQRNTTQDNAHSAVRGRTVWCRTARHRIRCKRSFSGEFVTTTAESENARTNTPIRVIRVT